MSDLPVSPPPKQDTSLAAGVWTIVVFVAVCGVAASHTLYSGIFPFIAVAVSLTIIEFLASSTRR
jgi:hypothetical protein